MPSKSINEALPLKQWREDMREAADRIRTTGGAMLEQHCLAGDEAAARAEQWKLDERLDHEQEALARLIDRISEVMEAADVCLVLMAESDEVSDDALHQQLQSCSDIIEKNLPEIERELITVRHVALDLLRWTQRAGYIEESPLPDRFRACHADLINYTPVFKPRLAALQEDLLARSRRMGVDTEVGRLVSALSRYNAVADSARAFVKSVVEPPMQLVFHDTREFLEDFEKMPPPRQAAVATELNDRCQLLLYDAAAFHRRVDPVHPRLADGIDASLVALKVEGDIHLIFTVDEDPVFERIEITLLRAVADKDLERVREQLTRDLYTHLMDDSDER